MSSAAIFLTDVLSLVEKHKHMDPDIRIELLNIAVRNYQNQKNEIREAMQKHRIFYYNNSSN